MAGWLWLALGAVVAFGLFRLWMGHLARQDQMVRDRRMADWKADRDLESSIRASERARPPLNPPAPALTIGIRTEIRRPEPTIALASPPRWIDDRDPDQFEIEYGDVDGIITRRRIRVRHVERFGSAIYVRGDCALRDAERTFRVDRILDVRACSTGASITSPIAFFGARLAEFERPDPEHESVMGRAKASLGVLIWIARADRDIAADEMEVLLDFVQARNALGGAKFAALKWNRNRAIAEIEDVRPTLGTASAALLRMSPAGREIALVGVYARRLAALGGAASEKRRKQLFPAG